MLVRADSPLERPIGPEAALLAKEGCKSASTSDKIFNRCLDIAHGIHHVLGKGMDTFGGAAAAQCDIRKYYDSLLYAVILYDITRTTTATTTTVGG